MYSFYGIDDLSKTIIFIDLDNSLIFSKRKIKNFNKNKWIQATFNKNNNNSYIHKEVLKILKNNLNKNTILVPTTARTLDSFKNTIFYQDKELFKYIKYINTSFSAYIYDQHLNCIKNNITNIKISKNILNDIYNKFYNIEKININDNIYIEIKKSKKSHYIKNYIKENYNNMFKIYESTTTLTFYPKELDKNLGVKYIIKKEKPTLTIGVGDNLVDKKFLKLVNIIILPNKNYFI